MIDALWSEHSTCVRKTEPRSTCQLASVRPFNRVIKITPTRILCSKLYLLNALRPRIVNCPTNHPNISFSIKR